MRIWVFRTTVAITTLTLGITVSLGVRSLARTRQVKELPAQPCPTPTVEPPKGTPAVDSPSEYPDVREITPSNIQSFLDENPHANLEKLWKRLGITSQTGSLAGDFKTCDGCKADCFEYDLDGQPGDETVLRISSPLTESFRYLVFKWEVERIDRPDKWKLLGFIDEWGKYKESRHVVLISSGTPVLVVQGQAISGSGVALYNERLFRVTPTGIKQLLTYPAEGHQSGWRTGPDRDFSARVISYRLSSGKIEAVLNFEVRYYDRDFGVGKETLLLSKTQTAVYSGPSNRNLVFQPRKSTITQREIEHIYNIDSMTEEDFLKVNFAELLQIARKGNTHKKSWLKEYLESIADSAEKNRLLAALRK